MPDRLREGDEAILCEGLKVAESCCGQASRGRPTILVNFSGQEWFWFLFFRINDDFSFDDDFAEKFGATVRAFDPRYVRLRSEPNVLSFVSAASSQWNFFQHECISACSKANDVFEWSGSLLPGGAGRERQSEAERSETAHHAGLREGKHLGPEIPVYSGERSSRRGGRTRGNFACC